MRREVAYLAFEQVGGFGTRTRELPAPGRLGRKLDFRVQRASRIVEILQKPAGFIALGNLQGRAQIGDDPIEIAQHHIHRDRNRRCRDMISSVAHGRVDGKADQLPWRAKPAHHDQQSIEKHVAVAADG